MATTGDHLGNLRKLYIDGDVVGCTTQMSLSFQNEEVDSTCKDNDGAKQSLPGQQSWSVSLSGFQVFNNNPSVDDLLQLCKDRTEFTCLLSTEVTGDTEYQGTAYIASMEIVDNVNEVASYSCTIQGTGPLALNVIA